MHATKSGQGYAQAPDGTWQQEQPKGAPVCSYCKEWTKGWLPAELARGKRAMRPGPGVEYHCITAFYGAQ